MDVAKAVICLFGMKENLAPGSTFIGADENGQYLQNWPEFGGGGGGGGGALGPSAMQPTWKMWRSYHPVRVVVT